MIDNFKKTNKLIHFHATIPFLSMRRRNEWIKEQKENIFQKKTDQQIKHDPKFFENMCVRSDRVFYSKRDILKRARILVDIH